MTPAAEPIKELTLYHLSTELMDLLSVRAEMCEGGEDTTEIDVQIAEYVQRIPDKVDATAHVLRTLESQETLAMEEISRLHARRKRIVSALEHLKQYLCSVLEQLPKPKRGCRKLEGSTAELVLV